MEDISDIILKGLNKSLVGREFIYCSKYGGETKGKVKSVSITSNLNFDKETNRKLKIKMSKYSPKIEINDLDYQEIKVPYTWRGCYPSIYIHSESGQTYEFIKDKLYFLDEKSRN